VPARRPSPVRSPRRRSPHAPSPELARPSFRPRRPPRSRRAARRGSAPALAARPPRGRARRSPQPRAARHRPASRASAPPARSAVRTRVSRPCATSTIGSTPIIPASPLIVWSARNRSRTARGRDVPARLAASMSSSAAFAAATSSSDSAMNPATNSLRSTSSFTPAHGRSRARAPAGDGPRRGSRPGRTASRGSPTHPP